jgi:hypothetical protein
MHSIARAQAVSARVGASPPPARPRCSHSAEPLHHPPGPVQVLRGAPPPTPRTKWTRRVPHSVLIGHAASLSGVR